MRPEPGLALRSRNAEPAAPLLRAAGRGARWAALRRGSAVEQNWVVCARRVWRDGDPYGTRTRVSAVRGPRPGPLDEGAVPPSAVATPARLQAVIRPSAASVLDCYTAAHQSAEAAS